MTETKQSLLLICNPHAGKTKIRMKLLDIVDIFNQNGYSVQVYVTQGAADATRAVQAYGDQVDRIVCVGGDGTFSEVLAGIHLMRQRPPIGYIPAGTTNDFADAHGLPRDMLEAARYVAQGVPKELDAGIFNGHPFAYVVGFGAFTHVPYSTPQDMKATLGHSAYLIQGVKQLSALKSYPMRVEVDGDEVIEGDFLVGLISNSTRVAGFYGMHSDVHMDDGLHELLLVHSPQSALQWQEILRALFQPDISSKYVLRRKVRQVHASSESPVDWVLDGEFAGSFSEIDMCNEPRAFQLLMRPNTTIKEEFL